MACDRFPQGELFGVVMDRVLLGEVVPAARVPVPCPVVHDVEGLAELAMDLAVSPRVHGLFDDSGVV